MDDSLCSEESSQPMFGKAVLACTLQILAKEKILIFVILERVTPTFVL
jgi:hypothetical protein